MARKKKYKRRRKSPVPILPVLGGVVSPLVQSFNTVGGLQSLQSNPTRFLTHMADQIMQRYTGIHMLPEFGTGINTAYLFNTYGGLLAGVFGHWLASKTGVNRYMKKLPVIGNKIQL